MQAGEPEAVFLLEREPTPLGEMLVVTDARGRLRALDWSDTEARLRSLLRRQYRGSSIELRPSATSSTATRAMRDYFRGDVFGIDQLEIATGGTDFQREVWRALRRIPCGESTHYGALAARLGKPLAVRAVGLANGANPIGVIVPCHRVLGANGALTGYAGGLERKRWLLEHERKWAAAAATKSSGVRRQEPEGARPRT